MGTETTCPFPFFSSSSSHVIGKNMFHSLDPKTRRRVERRYAELKMDPERFIRRFDLNNDGVLDQNETHAALATLSHDLLHEEALSQTLTDTDLQPGMTLRERYQILSEIGNGAQGIAYAARDLTTNQIVVVKQLRLSHMDAWDAYDAFRREAEVLARLSHPRLPRFIDAFQVEKNNKYYYFSIQSLVPGRNLADRLESGELFLEKDLVSIAHQCLEILSYLHLNRPSVLHRDIKPSNLLLDDNGVVYLVDFGAVQYTKATKTMAVGTAGYMPSEQLLGEARPQSDLYSLGATLVRLATRIHPHDLDLQQMRLVWRPNASLSVGFSNWIDKLIDPEIEDRFQSAFSAKTFLSEKKNVFVRRETKKNSRLSLELIEQFADKPPDSEVRIWESVDQFVCTFPRNENRAGGMTGIFSEIMKTLFQIGHYHDLSRHGGGFSFDSDGKCRVTAKERGKEHQITLMNRKVNRVRNRVFNDGYSGLVGFYDVRYGNNKKEVQVALATGLDRFELAWVWKQLAVFLSSHKQRLT